MEHPTRNEESIVNSKKKKLALKRTTLRVLSGADLGQVAGGTTILLTPSTAGVIVATEVGAATMTWFCNRDDTDLARR